MSSTLSVVETSPVRDGAPSSPASVNDLAIRVGTVNGSGSQSANLVLLRALYAMGIPCSGKNVFPSNIEGCRPGSTSGPAPRVTSATGSTRRSWSA